MKTAILSLLCLLAVATSASVGEAAMTISQAVLLSSNGNRDDDLNASYYIQGVMDGLLQIGAYQCSKTLPNYGEFIRQTKEVARQQVLGQTLGATPAEATIIHTFTTTFPAPFGRHSERDILGPRLRDTP